MKKRYKEKPKSKWRVLGDIIAFPFKVLFKFIKLFIKILDVLD